MPDTDYSYYTRLEPHHDVMVDDEGYQIVLCPFEITDDGEVVLHDHPVVQTASFSPNANPEEVDCPRCAVFNGELHFAGPPAHEHPGEDEVDEPPIGGASHGSVHHISEYQPCKVPLRRIPWCGVTILVHEGAVASLGRIEDRYYDLNGPNRYRFRQADTAFYVCRKTVSGNSWSKHSLCAGDLNWQTNGYGASTYDLPMWIVQLFLDEGWGWGGFWKRIKDWMHLSKSPNEGGDGLLYVGGSEEDDMFEQTDKERLERVETALSNILAYLGGKSPDVVGKAVGRGDIVSDVDFKVALAKAEGFSHKTGKPPVVPDGG